MLKQVAMMVRRGAWCSIAAVISFVIEGTQRPFTYQAPPLGVNYHSMLTDNKYVEQKLALLQLLNLSQSKSHRVLIVENVVKICSVARRPPFI